MKWTIPAKTFLLGEYAALAGASAIILTTTPCFELSLIPSKELIHIHPEAPAGRWWLEKNNLDQGLCWNDPYKGQGGLGASSAQFLGAYLASCTKMNTTPNVNDLLDAYYQCSWSGSGVRPSGYDVIAQSQAGCVYINKQKQHIQSYHWVFDDISFILVHTQKKLATHHHLQSTVLPKEIDQLSYITEEAKTAFDRIDSSCLIQAINSYHNKLFELHLVAEHSMTLINQLKTYPEVLAIKGCGALGADVLLLITAQNDAAALQDTLTKNHWMVLATEKNILNYNKKTVLNPDVIK